MGPENALHYSTSVTDSGLACLRDLPVLRSLSISSTEISDAGLRQIADLHQLRRLSVSSPRITDAGIAQVAELPVLDELIVTRTNRVTAAAMDRLEAESNVRRASLRAAPQVEGGRASAPPSTSSAGATPRGSSNQ